MSDRRISLYFGWSRPAETGAPLGVINDSFPAVFELRRLFHPKFEELADSDRVDSGIAGFWITSRSRISLNSQNWRKPLQEMRRAKLSA